MKRPAFQFYTADWQGNSKLRRCSHAQKGIWVDVLCLMHDSDEYGVLRWPLEDIAQAIGCTVKALREVVTKGVLKGAELGENIEAFIYTPRHAGKDGEPVVLIPAQDGPIWYSSRMVRDEYVRSKRGEGTRFGDEPKPTPTRRIGEEPIPPKGDGPTTTSSSTTTKKEKPPFVLPAWVPEADWIAFDEHRKKLRKPMTDYAKRLVVKELDRLRKDGDDPATVLQKAVRKGWLDVYPLNEKGPNPMAGVQ